MQQRCRTSRVIRRAILGIGVVAALVAAGFGSAQAQAQTPKNVVLIILDDVGERELPFLNPPIRWSDPDNPAASAADLPEAALRRPSLNRLEARMFASRTLEQCPGEGVEDRCAPLGTAPGDSRLVAPVDLDVGGATTASAFRYKRNTGDDPCGDHTKDLRNPGACDSSRDILDGFGGIAELARGGVVFDRFYATAALCTPTRSSIFTGRHPSQVGTSGNKGQLESSQVTIADLLDFACEQGKPCYATGHMGKWHIGNKSTSKQEPWQRGYDQSFSHGRNARGQWDDSDFQCSPPPIPEGASGVVRGYFCMLPIETSHCDDDLDCTTCPGGDDDNNPATPQRCACAGDTGACYARHPLPCDPKPPDPEHPEVCAQCACDQCRPWGTYIGTGDQHACHPDDMNDFWCCEPARHGPFSTQAKDLRATADGDWTAIESHYFFKHKANPNEPGSSPGFWKKDGQGGNFPCNDDGATDVTGCIYDTRMYRDFAKTFIVRHRAEHFFLSIAPQALHHDRDAPFRTEAHYKTTPSGVPKAKTNVRKYWGALEEVDAAVGQILSLLDGFCTASTPEGDRTYALLGAPCQVSADCGGGGQCVVLKNDTVVMFTADQGGDQPGFGTPNLREKKGTTYDGGLRVPLVVWAGDGSMTGGGDHVIEENYLGSQVDLFATIADIAGFGTEDDGHVLVKVCQNAGVGRTFCDDDHQCPSGGGPCVERKLAGRTLLPLLRGDAPGLKRRDFAYAAQPGQAKMVTTRKGYFCDANGNGTVENSEAANCSYAGTMCGYEKVQAEDPQNELNDLDRIVHGASCASCARTESESLGGCDGESCYVRGVCVVTDPQMDLEAIDCLNDQWDQNDRCTPIGNRICRSNKDCPDHQTCRTTDVTCNRCLDATWKLRASGGDGASGSTEDVSVVELFEMGGNPEEVPADNQDAVHPVPTSLDCKASADSKITSVRNCLACLVDEWYDCTSLAPGGDDQDCEAPKLLSPPQCGVGVCP